MVNRLSPKSPTRFKTGIAPLAHEISGNDAEATGLRQRKNQLIKARQYYLSFKWADLERFRAIDWSKAELLLRIRNKKRREQLLKGCKAENWRLSDVRRAVAFENGQKLSAGRGVLKPIKFDDAESALADIYAQAFRWMHHHNNSWLGVDTKLTRTNIRRLRRPHKQILFKVCQELKNVAEAVGSLQRLLEPFCGAEPQLEKRAWPGVNEVVSRNVRDATRRRARR